MTNLISQVPPGELDQARNLRELATTEPDTSASAQLTLLPDELAAARTYAEGSRAPATRRAYASDWRIFSAWCERAGATPIPAEPALVAIFLSAEAARGIKPATVVRRLAAIGYAHERARLPAPMKHPDAIAIKEVMAGIRRAHGTAPVQKRAADGDVLRDLLRAIEGDDPRALRDRAVLGLGMASALRRSELVALEVGDLQIGHDGLRLTVRRGKTDQEGAGAVIAVPAGRRIEPVRLVREWLDLAGHADGPLFRRLTRGGALTNDPMSDRAVARLVQKCAATAGHEPAHYAGHSLRSGFLTEAARQGASVFKMREVSRHKSMDVLSEYVRDADLLRDHAGGSFL